ncbi:hypothetical protein [Lysobacter sp. Root604]|uniref:hypothetical protein n=1 Tax=Lysobacter sp. Root604 TaxID=1736568 RepID=UPI0006F327CE|nr:hypothetical protein [Lysobacter sp. Root604]KRA20804.1 hypothetical protein ASD69_05730 [Lysobacter sp. Root604]
MQTIYVYVDDSDNIATEALLVSAFRQLADQWSSIGAFAVNQRHERTPDLLPDDLPDWFIGLNVPLDQFGPTQAAEVVPFARALARATGQEFVVGVASASGIADDLIFLGPDAGEREYHDLLQRVAGP